MRPGPDSWTTDPETGKRELTQEYKDTEQRWREGEMFPKDGSNRLTVVTPPTRDLNQYKYRETEKERGRSGGRRTPRWQDRELPQKDSHWGSRRDWDDDTVGTTDWIDRDNDRTDDRYQSSPRERRRGRGNRAPSKMDNWWERPRQQPRRPAPYTPQSGLSSDSDRFSLLTGSNDRPRGSLSSDADRFALLTGASDSRPDYGRETYAPQDRKFNRQFSEAPRGPQPWGREADPVLKRFGDRGTTKNTPLENIPTRRDQREHTLSDYERGGDIEREYDEWRGIKGNVPPRNETSPRQYWEGGRKWETQPAQSWDYGGDLKGSIPEGRTDITPYDDTELKKRLAALEERGSIVTQPTQDLSGITGRLSELEGRKPDTSWQEDRIKALEERKPDTSWKDPLSELQTGQQQGATARSALDTRLAALEDYYKNDPPPEVSLGSRYEDKAAELARVWEVKNPQYDPNRLVEVDQPDHGWGNTTWGERGQGAWGKFLPKPYEQQMRALNREYNKPTYEATIKGRDYKSYGQLDQTRLRYLDDQNIHEDEYLGRGEWKNKYGEDITGWSHGYYKTPRWFTSHSGLDRDSDEYKDRFGSYDTKEIIDHAWYN